MAFKKSPTSGKAPSVPVSVPSPAGRANEMIAVFKSGNGISVEDAIKRIRVTNILPKRSLDLADSIMRVGKSPGFLKPFGSVAHGDWLLPNTYCPKGCGTKLRTDGKVVWCSFVMCDYIDERTV